MGGGGVLRGSRWWLCCFSENCEVYFIFSHTTQTQRQSPPFLSCFERARTHVRCALAMTPRGVSSAPVRRSFARSLMLRARVVPVAGCWRCNWRFSLLS